MQSRQLVTDSFYLIQKMLVVVQKKLLQYQLHRETVGLMLTNFRVGDRVEHKETHKLGRVTFVYSELEFKGDLSRSCSTATTKRSLFRPTAFTKSQGGSRTHAPVA
jgi:hypothetical protein